jgi:hypothetical protein
MSADWPEDYSRCLHGVMKGHIGTVKSAIAELTDETNIARGFSLPPVAWSLGGVFGFVVVSHFISKISPDLPNSFSPLIGGILSRPQDRWPHLFSHHFWADYPYFLPCLVAAFFTCLSLVVNALYLEEVCPLLCSFREGCVMTSSQTLNSRPSEKFQLARTTSPEESDDDDSDVDMTPDESDKPLPMRAVITKPVLITIANYAMLALLSAVLEACTPLVWSTPIEFGGLNLSPEYIGLWMSLYGGMDGLFQFFVFPRFFNRFGLRRVFVCSIFSTAVIFILFPFENIFIRAGGGLNVVVWLLIILQLVSLCFFDSGYRELYFFFYSLPPILMTDHSSYNIHVRFIVCSEQTIAWRGVWPGPGGDSNPERCWTDCCGLAICVLTDT